MDDTYLKLLPSDLMLEFFLYLPLSVIIDNCINNFFSSTICNNEKYWQKRAMSYYGESLKELEEDEDEPPTPLLIRYYLNMQDYIRPAANILQKPRNKTEEQWKPERDRRIATMENAKRDLQSLRESIIKLLEKRAQHDKLKYFILINTLRRRQFSSPLVEAYNIADALIKVDRYMMEQGFDLLTRDLYGLTEDWFQTIEEKNVTIANLLNFYIESLLENMVNDSNDFYFIEVIKVT